MKTLLLVHGPNLNRLGARDERHYGACTLADIEQIVVKEAHGLGYDVRCFQSNHEGGLIDWIQEQSGSAVGLIINPGALTHTSYALADAIRDAPVPCVEVHLSAISQREAWRRVSVTADVCIGQIEGRREEGYREAVRMLHSYLHHIHQQESSNKNRSIY